METGMSSGQALALCVATSITGSLSLLGSGTIIYCILKEEFQSSRQNYERRQPRRRQRLLKRFLLTLSIADMLATTGFIMGVYAMPSSTQLPFAMGNVASCDVAGVLSNFLTAVVFANCNLSFYYLWIVRRQVQQLQLQLQQQQQSSATTSSFQNTMILSPNKERCMHALPFILAAIMIVVCMSLQGYNPRSLLRGCGLEMYPLECELEESIECTRGLSNGILGYVQMILGVLPTCVGLFNTVVVYRTVTRMSHPNAATTAITDHYQPRQQLSHRQRRNRKIMIQCILYMASFLNSSLWPTFVAFAAKDRVRMSQAGGPFYILLFLTHLFLPLQGFFNLLIFKPKCIQHIICYCCGRQRGTQGRQQSSMRRLFDKVKQGFQDESEMPSTTSNLAASMTTARTRRTTNTSINNWQESGNTSFSMRDFSQSMSQSMNFQQSCNNNSGITHHNYNYRYHSYNNNHSNSNSRRFSLTSIMSERSFSMRNNIKNDNDRSNQNHDDSDSDADEDVDVVVDGGLPIAPILVQPCTDVSPSPLQQWILDYNMSTTLTGILESFHEEKSRDYNHHENNHNAVDDDDDTNNVVVGGSSLPLEINPKRAWSPRSTQRPNIIFKEQADKRTSCQQSYNARPASNEDNHDIDDGITDDNDNSNKDGSSSLPDDISSLQMSAVEGKPPPRQFPPLPLDFDGAITPGPYLFGSSNHALVLHTSRDDDGGDHDAQGRLDEEIMTTSTAESNDIHDRHHYDTDGGEGDEDTSLDNTTFNSAVQSLQRRNSPADDSLEISPSQRRRMLDLMMSAPPTTQRQQQKEKQERGKDEDKSPPLPSWRDGVAPPSLQLPIVKTESRVEQYTQQREQLPVVKIESRAEQYTQQREQADGEDSSEDSLKRHFKLMQELH